MSDEKECLGCGKPIPEGEEFEDTNGPWHDDCWEEQSRECDYCSAEGIPFTKSLAVHLEYRKEDGSWVEEWYCDFGCLYSVLVNMQGVE